MKIPYSDNQNKRELDSNTKCCRKSMLYLYTVQNVFVVHKLQHLLTASFLHAMYILLPSHPPSFTGYKSYSAHLPNVVLLCCSPACFSAPWVEWKCVKSLGSVMSLGCKGVSPKPWRLARASKFEDAWVLGILKGAVAFKNQDQDAKLEPQNVLGNCFKQCVITLHFTDSGKLNKP